MQALILAGGEGTRLRPLTTTIPKPVVPIVDRPHIRHMLDWLHASGVDDVLMGCGHMAAGVRAVLGDGEDLGMRLRYLEEPAPLGTGGAVKFAAEMLGERFLVLNGDVLSDIDLAAQIAQHERSGAVATLALVPVEDPSAYGLVRVGEDGAVAGFLEKPEPEEIDTDLISAGAYVLERSVLDLMPAAGQACSIERDVWPRLVGAGLQGYIGSGYWIDIGTPERYLQASFDVLDGTVHTESHDAADTCWVGEGATVAADASIGPYAVIGSGAAVAAGATVERSVILDGAVVGAGARLREAIVAPGAVVGERAEVTEGAMLGAGARLGADCVLRAGARLFPGVEVPDGGIRFG